MVSFIHWLPFLLILADARRPHFLKTFNVLSYGARPDRITDNSMAFLRAWKDACEHDGGGRVWIPRGEFKLDSVVFVGPCKGPVDFVIRGLLEASTDPSEFFVDHWIAFKYVDQLVVRGGGYLFGNGRSAWQFNDCATNSRCKPLPVAQSNVQIKNVTFRKVHGTSSSKIAVKIQCSKHVPCEGVNLVNINLEYRGPEGPAASSCMNVKGKSYGRQLPAGCL
ncbi:unnamed protein product [Lactuca virosa]|uniref:Polygalacturonase n=1 Tax=Lactuca virosa TaxID=75947 RepID=A0AAU9MYY0_9ASTR|nr:unnamed protein product [Lactuca virosa]